MSELIIIEPKIIKTNLEEKRAELTLFLPPELDYFKGHFPEVKLLAGVVQLDWAVQYTQQYLNFSGCQVRNIEVLKFQVMLIPSSTVLLHLEEKNSKKVIFKYSSDKGIHASGRIVFESF